MLSLQYNMQVRFTYESEAESAYKAVKMESPAHASSLGQFARQSICMTYVHWGLLQNRSHTVGLHLPPGSSEMMAAQCRVSRHLPQDLRAQLEETTSLLQRCANSPTVQT